MSENKVLENEIKFWENKEASMVVNTETSQFKCGECDCNANCEKKEPITYCDYEKCNETYGQCLDCEIVDIWKYIIKGETSKEFIDNWISMKTLLLSFLKDQESAAANNLKKELKVLELLRDHQKE
jgi:hypothetical protein